jgi:serine/threonine protein kinase
MLRLITNKLKGKTVNEKTKLLDKYTIIRVLGKGVTSTVYKVMDNNSYNYYTCKSLRADKNNAAMREVKILNKLPAKDYFSQITEIIEDDNNINIIMDYVPGQDLFEWFENILKTDRSLITSPISQEIFINMVKITKNLHHFGLVHLDLKLENFIISNKEESPALTLIDYASCHPYHNNPKTISRIVGTRGYAPFEIYKGVYYPETDVWSLGICLWLLLTGTAPFNHNNLSFLNKSKITGKDFIFPNKYHNKFKSRLPADAFDLISQMLTVDPDKRIKIDVILKHQWFNNIDENELYL